MDTVIKKKESKVVKSVKKKWKQSVEERKRVKNGMVWSKEKDFSWINIFNKFILYVA